MEKNQYISRYARNDKHFNRTDPFKYASFGLKIFAGFCFCAIFLSILFLLPGAFK